MPHADLSWEPPLSGWRHPPWFGLSSFWEFQFNHGKAWLFSKQQENQLSGFQFSLGSFRHFSMPKRETAYNFVRLKSLARQLMVFTQSTEIPLVASAGSYVGIIWNHSRKAFVPKEVRMDLGDLRSRDVLKPRTDSSDSLFHLDFCQCNSCFIQQTSSKASLASQSQQQQQQTHPVFFSLLWW